MTTSVIIIDDERDGVDVLSEFLKLKGIDVLAKGYNGLEAVQLYKKFKPDFVLLDLLMPSYDGFYGLSKILEFDNNAKVIIVSASCEREDEKKLFDLGALEVVAKPYEIKTLTDIFLKTNIEKDGLINSLYN